jgi:hypothetical protein
VPIAAVKFSRIAASCAQTHSADKRTGHIGVIVVPSDRLQTFLTDRTPSLKDALRYVEQEFKEATTFLIVIIAIEHDAPGKALPKKKTNRA